MAEKIYSEGVISRLSQYLKYIVQLKELGKRTATSGDISSNTGVNSAEVRRDLIYFRIKGKRGVGFNIDDLISSFNKILGYDRSVRIDSPNDFVKVLILIVILKNTKLYNSFIFSILPKTVY